MVLYNITVNIDFDVESDWVKWMKEVHIPNVMATKAFASNKMFKLLNEVPDANGATYSIQYFANNMAILDDYIANKAPALVKEHMDKFGSKHVAFRSVLQEI